MVGPQICKWVKFDIFGLSYKLTSHDLWPSFVTFDPVNMWRFLHEVNFTFWAHFTTWPLMTFDLSIWPLTTWKYKESYIVSTRRFSNHESRLLSQSHTYAIIVIIDLKIHQSMWIHWPFFSKNLNQRLLTPTWPLTPCLLRSHVWLYPRIIVSKFHGNTSMYVDTVINFANYHIHTHTYIHTTYILHTYYVHTTYRMSDHIVSYWTQFRRDNKPSLVPIGLPTGLVFWGVRVR